MNWWHKLKHNSLAKIATVILILLYTIAIFGDFVAPYNAYESQNEGSLLPPTQIYWQNQQGQFIGAHVYPVTQGVTDLNTGDRQLNIDFSQPSPIHFFIKGDTYQLFQIKLPLPPTFKEVEIFSGIKLNIHLFGTKGKGRINLLGTDEQGRDQFSRIIHGSKISLFIGLIGISISFPLGMIIGGIAGYYGGWLDAILMRLVEVLMTIPSIYLLVALAAVLPPSLSSAQRFIFIILITSFISWAGLARVIRGQVLSIKEQDFIQAIKAIGGKSFYIIINHVLPQSATYIIISTTLAIPSFIIAESVLSLIGLGIQQPDPSWGNLLSLASNASILVLQPWLIFPPAFLIILTVLCFNLLGDGLRDALDPRNKY